MKLRRLALVVALVFLSRPAMNATGRERPYQVTELDARGIPPLLEGVLSKQDWREKRAEIMKAWLTAVGDIPPRVPVRFEVLSETREASHVVQRIVFDSVFGDRIPALLLTPHGVRESHGKVPAILALHPTNAAGKDAIARSTGTKNRMYAVELAERGYVVLAPDDMTAGERIFPGQGAFRDKPFYEQYPDWSTVGKNLVDHLQAVDLLCELPYVDRARIGVIGHSFGGYNAYFLSAVDLRIRVVISSCGLSPFARSANRGHWGVRKWYTHLPSITDSLNCGIVPFEFNEIIALSAPIPMFFYAAQEDHIFPHWVAIGECLGDVRQLYSWMGVADRFRFIIGSGDHDFPPEVREMSFGFLDQWLKGAAQSAREQ
jgi:hypothetical protein